MTYWHEETRHYRFVPWCWKCLVTDEPIETSLAAEDASGADSADFRIYGMTLQIRRQEGSSGFSDTAVTAAGGLASPVHTAEVEVKLNPQGDPGDSFPFDFILTGNWHIGDTLYPPSMHDPVNPWPARITWNEAEGRYEGTIWATHDGVRGRGTVYDGENNPSEVPHYYAVRSSRKRDSSATISTTEANVNASASVSFAWASEAGGSGIEADEEFVSCRWENVSTLLGLEDGTPIDGHLIQYTPTAGTAFFWVPDDPADDSIGEWMLFDIISGAGPNGLELDWGGNPPDDAGKLGFFMAFGVPVELDENGDPVLHEYDEEEGEWVESPDGQPLNVNATAQSITDHRGKALMWQKHYANDYFVTNSITFKAEDQTVVQAPGGGP